MTSPKGSELDQLAMERVTQTAEQRRKTFEAVGRGEPLDAEPEADRRAAYRARVGEGGVPPPNFEEAIQGGTIDYVDVTFLSLGASKARAVARIKGRGNSDLGTGFLISPRLLITNNHVLGTSGECLEATAEFDYEVDEARQVRAT